METILFYNAVDRINDNRKALKALFDYLGTIDSCISIASFRSGEKQFCRPEFVSAPENKVRISEVRHPLVNNCVENDIELRNKSLIVTGSNMAGKTTFIKTIGINAILSQYH
ncbi:MAG: hypothetical protein U5Q03_11570 [Bacteroidota bacterium]|nr:hypothetical protein [Bacteroidota bacterium]